MCATATELSAVGSVNADEMEKPESAALSMFAAPVASCVRALSI